jgi:dTMP kinase
MEISNRVKDEAVAARGLPLSEPPGSGIFISFEGIDYSGKSEQCRRLVACLRAAGYDNVESLREPGGVQIAEAIRRILLDHRNVEMNTRTELLLFSAARAQITSEKILPALQAGKIVVVDRYVDTTTVYQGFGRQLDLELVAAVSRFATFALLPHLTLLIDVPWSVAQERQRRANLPKDRFEREQPEFFERVRAAYVQLAQQEPQRFVTIDGTPEAEVVAARVNQAVRERLELKI